MSRSPRRVELAARLRAAPLAVARHQPHPRGAHARARPPDAVRARRCADPARASSRAAAVPAAAAVLERARRGAAATAAERAEDCARAPASERCMAAFYLNELLLTLTTRHDPLPELFDHYRRHAGAAARRGGRSSRRCGCSRRACWSCSATVSTCQRGRYRRAGARPSGTITSARRARPGRGLRAAAGRASRARSLQRLAGAGASSDERDAAPRRARLLHAALDPCLEGRPAAHPGGGALGGGYPRRERTSDEHSRSPSA